MAKKRDLEIVKLAFIAAIVSLGGWAIFSGVNEIIGFNNLLPFWRVVIGLVIVWVTFKLGLKKL